MKSNKTGISWVPFLGAFGFLAFMALVVYMLVIIFPPVHSYKEKQAVLKAGFDTRQAVVNAKAARIAEFKRQTDDIMPVGYFKNSARVRIKTYNYMPGTSPRVLEVHASNQPNSGPFTAIYYYAYDAPNVTHAGSISRANRIIFDGDYQHEYACMFYSSEDGDYEFVDCENDPTNDLCKH